MHIDLQDKGYTVAGAKVTGVGMIEGGDLAVYWEADSDADAVMEAFYWENEFTDTLKQIIRDAGFSDAAADDICTSEWGMQDEGRASYDAYTLGEEIAAA